MCCVLKKVVRTREGRTEDGHGTAAATPRLHSLFGVVAATATPAAARRGGSRGCIRPRCRGSSFFLLVWPPSNESTWNPPIATAIATAASSSSFGTARIQYVVLGRRRNRSLLPQPPIRLPQGSYHTSHVPNRLRPPPRQEEEEEDHAVLMLRLRRPFRCSRFVLLLLLLLLVLLWMTMTMILITDATFDVRFSPCFCSREEVLWTMRIVLLLLLLLLRLRRLLWMPIILVGTAEGAELFAQERGRPTE